jgi:hypothetical protein
MYSASLVSVERNVHIQQIILGIVPTSRSTQGSLVGVMASNQDSI